MSLAQLLGEDPRPPWQVLLDALAASDALMRDGLAAVSNAGDQVTPDQLDRFVSSLERAAKLSKMTLDANVGERRTRLLEAQSSLMADAIGAGIDAVFARLVEQYGLSADQEVELRQLALSTAADRAEAADDPRTLRPPKDGVFDRTVRSTNNLKRGKPTPPWVKKHQERKEQDGGATQEGSEGGTSHTTHTAGEVVPLHPPKSPLE